MNTSRPRTPFRRWSLVASLLAAGLLLPTIAQAADAGGCPVPHEGEGQCTADAATKAAAGVAGAPATQPGATGRLTVVARQGTAGAPNPAGNTVNVTLFHRGDPVKTIEAKLDAQGRAELEGLPVGMVFQPLVRVTHGDLTFESVGEVMDEQHAQATVEVKVFEATTERPQWRVKMRHIMVQRVEAGLQVMEMIAVHNPADRAWKGMPQADGRYQTVALALPPQAANVQLLSGFDDCCTKVEPGLLSSKAALQPGATQYQIAYTLPIKDGQAKLTATAPAPVGHMMIFLPDDATKVQPEGLQSLGVMNMSGKSVRVFQANNLLDGRSVALSLSGLEAMAVVRAPQESAGSDAGGSQGQVAQASGSSSSLAPKLIAGVGGGAIVALGLLTMLVKPRKPAAS